MSDWPTLLWDFDGTLGRRRSGMWGACLLELLDRDLPGHSITREVLSPHLHSGFPWHDHGTSHYHLNEPERWWGHIEAILIGALERSGLPVDVARRLIPRFRDLYIDPETWELYPDTTEALAAAADAGWQNVIVSNHVPELPMLTEHLGLTRHVHAVVTSAAVGVEKPHPLIFRTALDAAGTPTHAWMIGDNPVADVAGAAKLGIPGVLVRVPAFSADYIERINCSYGHGDWIGWQELCELRASDALQAVELILGYGDVR